MEFDFSQVEAKGISIASKVACSLGKLCTMSAAIELAVAVHNTGTRASISPIDFLPATSQGLIAATMFYSARLLHKTFESNEL